MACHYHFGRMAVLVAVRQTTVRILFSSAELGDERHSAMWTTGPSLHILSPLFRSVRCGAGTCRSEKKDFKSAEGNLVGVRPRPGTKLNQ
jgi:hypothetical protein